MVIFVCIVFKISILILWSGGVEKVGFELGLLWWYVLGYTVRLNQLASATADGDVKYFVLVSHCYYVMLMWLT